jgi:predicted dehydrogenase
MSEKIRVLVVGLGNMGLSHAKAYHALPGFEIVGLCSRNIGSISGLPAELEDYARFPDYTAALAELKPDAVSINTYSDTHADFAVQAFEAGAHVFLEKPIAETLEDARRVVDTATRLGKKLVVGYILRHHPSWAKLVDVAQSLGKPLVMRMNLNQQSSGATWETHKTLMKTMSPIVDCGVHYVDMMCLMARAKPVKVHAMGVNLTPEIDADMYNYGQLQVFFDDGSIGWYEAGWGPMMSETAFFVKDVVGPKGCVSIVAAEETGQGHKSDDVDAHTKTDSLRLHFSDTDDSGQFSREDEIISTEDEPGHDDLCQREQEYFLDAIVNNVDLTDHMADAVNSLGIVLAADQSIKSGKIVEL